MATSRLLHCKEYILVVSASFTAPTSPNESRETAVRASRTQLVV